MQAQWNADQPTLAHKPLFGIRLVVIESRIMYEPSLADVQAGVLTCFDNILTRTDGIEDITSKVGPAGTSSRAQAPMLHHAASWPLVTLDSFAESARAAAWDSFIWHTVTSAMLGMWPRVE